jgi:hypothetical protein
MVNSPKNFVIAVDADLVETAMPVSPGRWNLSYGAVHLPDVDLVG